SSARGTLAPSAVALATNFCFARMRIPRSVLFNRERSFLLNKNGGISGIFRDFRRLLLITSDFVILVVRCLLNGTDLNLVAVVVAYFHSHAVSCMLFQDRLSKRRFDADLA